MRGLRTLLAVFVVAQAALVGGVGSVVADTGNTPTPTPTPTANQTATSTNTTAGGPGAADLVRITPVRLDGGDLGKIETRKQDESYNITGPFAVFSMSESPESVRMREDPGQARIVDEGTVKVEFDDKAAPVGKQSLYHLELFYSDGSQKTVSLYVEKTGMTAGNVKMGEYAPVVEDWMDRAAEAGYERSPDGLDNYWSDTHETAQLLDSLLSKQAKQLMSGMLVLALNPLAWILGLAAIALLSYRAVKRTGYLHDIVSNDSGRAQRIVDQIWIQFERDRQTAAEEGLSNLSEIGEQNEIYWRDSFGVSNVHDLAELAVKGHAIQDSDGEIVHVGGVDAIDPDRIEDSWLEAVCREGRVASPETALSHIKAALNRMCVEYGKEHRYRESYNRTRHLLDVLERDKPGSDVARYSTGGDD